MSMLYPAVDSVGTEVLVIENNKVIGKGASQIMRGHDFVGIRFTEGPVLELVKNFESIQVLGVRDVYFRYYPTSGMYCGTGFSDDEAETVLNDTLVVDSFKLRFGMVPDHFKNVEGYRSAYDAESDAEQNV